MTTGEADHRSYRYAVLADGVAHHAQIKDVHLPTLFADDHAKRAAFPPLKPTQR